MDLRHYGWYAPIEYTMTGGNRNARIIKDSIAATSDDAEYCHWDMSFLLHLFGGGAVRAVKHSIPAFADSFPCRTHAGGSIGDSWSVSHITPWTSEGSQLANRQNG